MSQCPVAGVAIALDLAYIRTVALCGVEVSTTLLVMYTLVVVVVAVVVVVYYNMSLLLRFASIYTCCSCVNGSFNPFIPTFLF